MTTWIVKAEVDDLERGREMVQQERNKGYKVWIEDENGRDVDEATLGANGPKRTKRTAYQTGMAVLIWGTAAIIGIASLYACSLLAGD
jgi:hypothetical protein